MEEAELLDQREKNRVKKRTEANNILVLGIASIFFFTIIGLILAIVTIKKSNSLISEYKSEPNSQDLKYYNRLKAGQNCAIAGISLKLLIGMVLYAIYS